MTGFKFTKIAASLAVAGLAAAVLVACGGGGAGGSTQANSLTGVALTGAPIASAQMTVTDSAGKDCATATASADGVWTAPLNNCGAAPYLIKASGTVNGVDAVFYSAATSEDVNTSGSTAKKVNVSQLTDAIIKIALKTDTPTAAGAATLTSENLKTASVDLMAVLLPDDVKTDAGIDLTKDIRTMTVTAGSGSALDKLHDRVPTVQVSTSGTTLGIVATVTGYASSAGGTDKNGTAAVGVTLNTAGASGTKPAAVSSGTVINGVTTNSAAATTPSTVAALDPKDRAKAEIALMLNALNTNWKAAAPSDATSLFKYTDACFLDNGADKAYNTAWYAANKAEWNAKNAYRVDATRTNLSVISVTPNATGTQRIADISYDIEYADGTKALDTKHRLVFGDSASVCTTHGLTASGQNLKAWRFVGDSAPGEKVNTDVTAINRVTRNFNIADGVERTANKVIQNRLDFNLSDPRNLGYTYAIVKGPSLPTAGLKFVFSSVYNSATNELAGKSGNYLNNTSDYDTARLCSTSSTSWNAATDDCATRGLGGFYWTQTDANINGTTLTNAAFTFDIYNDDGWKTVNGQNGKTPALTYTKVLKGKLFDSTYLEANYPTVTATLPANTVDFLTLAKSSGGTMGGTITTAINLPNGAKAMALTNTWNYSNGAAATNASGVSWPKYRQITRSYLKKTDTSFTGTILGKPSTISTIDYTEIGISVSDRNGHAVQTVYSFN